MHAGLLAPPPLVLGDDGNSSQARRLRQALYVGEVRTWSSAGHEHNYERFAPQNPSGAADLTRGIREFVVGMGGHSLYGFGTPDANSVARNSSSYGVLQMTLRPGK